MLRKTNTADSRKYIVKSVSCAKKVATNYLKSIELEKALRFGMPEIDDRYHVWRVPLINEHTKDKIGEIIIDAYTSLVNEKKSSSRDILENRLLNRGLGTNRKSRSDSTAKPKISNLRNTIGSGDCEELLKETPAESVDLIFTSPPYFNAKPEYSDYVSYEEYLLKLNKVIRQCHRILNEGRFFVINVSPVLISRASRNQSSRRIAVPFDVHALFIKSGFEFIDDIIWVKPEGAGWAFGRGRRFAADRNPLQYKPVPVTEYVLVYRKSTDKLIDWNIRCHPRQKYVKESKIRDGYNVSNVWKINPTPNKKHPATFPLELAENVIRYYSFKNDVVLDPFAGTGTVGIAAIGLERRFVLFEINSIYVDEIKNNVANCLKGSIRDVNFINCKPSNHDEFLF